MHTTLSDLDELVLQCRDKKSRELIYEAVVTYRAGAFRASIVATWVAVCFDIIEKIRELALTGDAEATKRLEAIEKFRQSNDVVAALQFEREIIEIAFAKLEFISSLEAIDLNRLREDRNRCSHPTLINDDEEYKPSAELARSHIHAAINHLLQHPATQGKTALNRILADISADYFPTERDKAREFLEAGPLKRYRKSLIRNLIIVLLKQLLDPETELEDNSRIGSALMAIHDISPEIFSETAAEKITPIARSKAGEDSISLILLIVLIENVWQYFEQDIRTRTENYILNSSADQLVWIHKTLRFPELYDVSMRRLNGASWEELISALRGEIHRDYISLLISLFLKSSNFVEANTRAMYFIKIYQILNTEHVTTIVENAAENTQITRSTQFPYLIQSLRQCGSITDTNFEQLLNNNNLESYAIEAEG